MRLTLLKRNSQICKTFKFKVDKSRLNCSQKEGLKMLLVEAKWIYNYIISTDSAYSITDKDLKVITRKDKNGLDIDTTLHYISASTRQQLIKQIQDQIKGLAQLKKSGLNVGKLKFKSEVNSLKFKQYGVTHDIRSKNKIKLQGIKKPIIVNGLNQLDKFKDKNIEFTTANLLYDGNDYYISLTCFIDKDNIDKQYKNDIVGIDMGVSTTLILSNGTKYDISVGESEKLKRLQAKLARQTKGSNNRYKTIKQIRKEYIHINNKKNDISNKIVHSILSDNKIIVIQDEQISEWRQDGLSGSKVQHSVLGRIKSKLMYSDKVNVLDKWFPTTKYCSNCGTKVELELKDRIFECPNCRQKEDRDIHAANNMIYFYLQYNKLDRLGTNQTSIKGPVKLSYNKFVSKLTKQEDTMSLALC
jgi:putative transposase